MLLRMKDRHSLVPASTRPRSFEGTGCQGSDLLTPGRKPAKFVDVILDRLHGAQFPQSKMTSGNQTEIDILTAMEELAKLVEGYCFSVARNLLHRRT